MLTFVRFASNTDGLKTQTQDIILFNKNISDLKYKNTYKITVILSEMTKYCLFFGAQSGLPHDLRHPQLLLARPCDLCHASSGNYLFEIYKCTV